MQHDFILLDRSGSMAEQNRWPETLSSVNAYVQKLAADKVDTGVTLAAFDNNAGFQFEVIRDRITPPTWSAVTTREIAPRGGTPLNDAIGRIVTLARAGFNGTPYDKVAIIIVTDGYENASNEITHTAAKALLADCRSRGWQVIMLGADYDNMAQASSYGNLVGQTFSTASANLSGTAQLLGNKRALYGATGQSMNLSDDEKVALNKNQPTP